jgi:leader peptidase (prepilin peptidase)/N-methyltransferase
MSVWAHLWSVDAGWGWLHAVTPTPWQVVAFAGALGLCFGSFLNVVIFRLPNDRSIVWPASHCPNCSRTLPAWENVPVLSYVFLGARCRGCKTPISWRYPLVELLGGAALALAVWRWGLAPGALWASAFALFLIAVAWIDAEHRIIPDELSGGLLAFGLFARGFDLQGFAASTAGAFAGVLLLGGAAWAYRRWRGIDGLGGGDVKLIAGLGAFLGLPGLVITILLASAAGSVIGLGLMLRGRAGSQTALPFGTFLAAAAVCALAAGPALWTGYLSLVGFAP